MIYLFVHFVVLPLQIFDLTMKCVICKRQSRDCLLVCGHGVCDNCCVLPITCRRCHIVTSAKRELFREPAGLADSENRENMNIESQENVNRECQKSINIESQQNISRDSQQNINTASDEPCIRTKKKRESSPILRKPRIREYSAIKDTRDSSAIKDDVVNFSCPDDADFSEAESIQDYITSHDPSPSSIYSMVGYCRSRAIIFFIPSHLK